MLQNLSYEIFSVPLKSHSEKNEAVQARGTEQMCLSAGLYLHFFVAENTKNEWQTCRKLSSEDCSRDEFGEGAHLESRVLINKNKSRLNITKKMAAIAQKYDQPLDRDMFFKDKKYKE